MHASTPTDPPLRVLITGAWGFIGRALLAELARQGGLRVDGGALRPVQVLALDVAPPPGGWDALPWLTALQGDAADPGVLRHAFCPSGGAEGTGGVDVVFALGATLTTDAEAHFDQGLLTNLHGMLHLLAACRAQAAAGGGVPRLVYTSSIAAFGGPLPDAVGEDQVLRPQTSYGTQKAVNELLIDDHARRGVVDGRVLRLPIVVTRPGASAPSVSDRVAALIREPLAGRDAVCPLAPHTVVPLAAVQTVARALRRMAELPGAAFGASRVVNLPSCSVTVAELVQAVADAAPAGGPPPGRTRWQPDAALQAIVDAWPRRLVSARAAALGLAGDASVQAIVAQHLQASGGSA